MNVVAIAAVFGGAGLGALLRWALGGWLNPVFPTVPLGTVAANLIGGLLVGVAASFFAQHATLAPEWRLFAVTGFLGGLTTFSAYSVESLILLQRGYWTLAAAHTLAHVGGALACAVLGFAAARAALT